MPAREALPGTAARAHVHGAGPEPAARRAMPCRSVPCYMPCRAAARFPLHYKTLTALSLPSKPYYAGIQGSSSDPCRFFNGSVQARGRPASRSSHPPAPLRPRPPGARSAAPSPAAPSRQRTDTKRGSEAPRRAGERPRRGEDPARLSCRRLRGASPTAPTARAPPQPPVRPGRARRSPSATAPPHSTARSDATAAATAASQRGRAVPPGGQSAPCARGSAAAADGRGGAALRCAAGRAVQSGRSARRLRSFPEQRGRFRSAARHCRWSVPRGDPSRGVSSSPLRPATAREGRAEPLCSVGPLLGSPAAHREGSGTALPALPPCGPERPSSGSLDGFAGTGGERRRRPLVGLSYRRGAGGGERAAAEFRARPLPCNAARAVQCARLRCSTRGGARRSSVRRSPSGAARRSCPGPRR